MCEMTLIMVCPEGRVVRRGVKGGGDANVNNMLGQQPWRSARLGRAKLLHRLRQHPPPPMKKAAWFTFHLVSQRWADRLMCGKFVPGKVVEEEGVGCEGTGLVGKTVSVKSGDLKG